METNKLNRYVRVDYDRLNEIAASHAMNPFEIPGWRFRGVYPEHDWAYVALQPIANCFNAAFNLFEEPDKKFSVTNPDDPNKPFTGSFAMYRKLYEYFGETVIQSRDLLPHVESARALSQFFSGLNSIPCPELKASCGFDFAMGLESLYQGNPLNLLEESVSYRRIRAFGDDKKKGLVDRLVEQFPIAYGSDMQTLHGLKFPFFKRAQLVVVLLHGRSLSSVGRILPEVEDVHEVGAIADYELPKALRHLGIIIYSDELAYAVDNWQEIAKDSAREIEIRAATVVACMNLLSHMNLVRVHKLGPNHSPLNICHLDYWLWKLGKEARYLRPHLTRTNAY